MQNLSTKTVKHLLPVAGLIVCLSVASQAEAQVNSFDFSVSGDAGILAFADDPVMLEAMIKRSMWRFDNAIAAAFSRPAIDLTNESTSNAVITSLEFTIGNSDFNFDLFPTNDELIAAGFGTTLPAGVVATVSDFDASAAVAGEADANVLTLDFSGVAGGGLAPGESILFNTQLAFDTLPFIPNELPSFDQVFFSDFGNPAPNSEITVTFFDPDTQETSVAVQTLADISALDFEAAIHANGVRFFELQAVTGTAAVTTAIPEPATATQIGLLMSLAACRRCRRRAA